MRTIKFKGKRIDNGEWEEGGLLQSVNGITLIGDNQGYICSDGYGHYDDFNIRQVDPDTVCQFTGFLDKNGKEIYEGDVLRSDTYPFSRTEHNEYDNYYGAIGWSDKEALFYIVAIKNHKSSVAGISDGITDVISQEKMQDFEVIGNIHDDEWKQYSKYIQEEDKE